ncbi:unnamed protein product [Brassica rapa subsp. trilocularis]
MLCSARRSSCIRASSLLVSIISLTYTSSINVLSFE